jgi:energy-coupling factor transporter ATP-binding protein EcfA2
MRGHAGGWRASISMPCWACPRFAPTPPKARWRPSTAAACANGLAPRGTGAHADSRRDGMMGLVGFGLAAVVVFHYLVTAEGSGWAILLVYWVLMIPALGSSWRFSSSSTRSTATSPCACSNRSGPKRALPTRKPWTQTPPKHGPVPAPAIRFENVSVQQAGNQVLAVEALSIPAGEHVAIVGVSGAGKSSLGRTAPGLVSAQHRRGAGRRRATCRSACSPPAPAHHVGRSDGATVEPFACLRIFAMAERASGGRWARPWKPPSWTKCWRVCPWDCRPLWGQAGPCCPVGKGSACVLGRGICRGAPSLVILGRSLLRPGADAADRHAARRRASAGRTRLCFASPTTLARREASGAFS